MDNLNEIREKEKAIFRLEEILALLSWDQETGMPEKALEDRADQMAWIQQELSKQLTDTAWERLIESLKNQGDQKVWKLNLQRRYRINRCLPDGFMAEFVRTTSLSREAWLKARKEENFSYFLPYLEKVVEISRKRADFLGYRDEPYDALLDLYEPGVTARFLESVFDPLQKALNPLIEMMLKKQESRQDDGGVFDIAVQKKLHMKILDLMGYDLKKGRMDFSVHPFTTTLGPSDVRITTHLDERDFFNGLFSTIHEAGHGLYEQNLPSSWSRTVNGQACSLGIHESQSRFWENIIGRSRSFWRFMHSQVTELFPREFGKESPESLYKKANRVDRGFIRIDADEYTYNLHVILRFRLERQIINGKVDVKDLPELWKEESGKLLGVVPEKLTDGLLQDIHWSLGDWGYFPTYTLGNLYAAQIRRSLLKDLPEIDSFIEKGDFQPIRFWLKGKLHSRGALVSSGSLIRDISGKDLDSRYFIEYLEDKAKDLYAE